METSESIACKSYLKKAFFSGIQVNYFIICSTKLWLFSHFIQMEKSSELVALGKQLHETSYKREKEALIDSKIAIDFVKKGNQIVLHEVKKSPRLQKAHEWQLLYYLYYLKKEKGIQNAIGEIDYPLQREKILIELTQEKEQELEKMLEKIREIVLSKECPTPTKKAYCKKCSYYELCYT